MSIDVKKLLKVLPVGWKDEADTYSTDQLEAAIVDANAAIKQCEEDIAENPKVQGAKEILKDIMAPFTEIKKAQKAKISYALHLLEEKGALREKA